MSRSCRTGRRCTRACSRTKWSTSWPAVRECSRSRWGRFTKSYRAAYVSSPRARKGREHPTRTPPKHTAAEPRRSGSRANRDGLKSDRIDFAHESERQYARLLDFYQIEWEYEPRSFDNEWDEQGEVLKQFTPDFYLPQFETYIEVTTMNQKLVTKKNRKVRRLRELYPENKIKIFYQREYLALLQKYGLDRDGDDR